MDDQKNCDRFIPQLKKTEEKRLAGPAGFRNITVATVGPLILSFRVQYLLGMNHDNLAVVLRICA